MTQEKFAEHLKKAFHCKIRFWYNLNNHCSRIFSMDCIYSEFRRLHSLRLQLCETQYPEDYKITRSNSIQNFKMASLMKQQYLRVLLVHFRY